MMEDEKKIIEKLHSIEALYTGATTTGEKSAAACAIERMKRKLGEIQKLDPPIEYRFTFTNIWSRKLFIALLRRYNIRPYRFPRQKRTTVMAVVSKKFVDETLWPEYKALNEVLYSYVDDMTDRIIRKGVSSDGSEIEIRTDLLT